MQNPFQPPQTDSNVDQERMGDPTAMLRIIGIAFFVLAVMSIPGFPWGLNKVLWYLIYGAIAAVMVSAFFSDLEKTIAATTCALACIELIFEICRDTEVIRPVPIVSIFLGINTVAAYLVNAGVAVWLSRNGPFRRTMLVLGVAAIFDWAAYVTIFRHMMTNDLYGPNWMLISRLIAHIAILGGISWFAFRSIPKTDLVDIGHKDNLSDPSAVK